jgi:hypothetical protein
VYAQPVAVALNVSRVALADRERLILAEELVGGGLEGLAALQLAGAVLEAKSEIPFLGDALGVLKVSTLAVAR